MHISLLCRNGHVDTRRRSDLTQNAVHLVTADWLPFFNCSINAQSVVLSTSSAVGLCMTFILQSTEPQRQTNDCFLDTGIAVLRRVVIGTFSKGERPQFVYKFDLQAAHSVRPSNIFAIINYEVPVKMRLSHRQYSLRLVKSYEVNRLIDLRHFLGQLLG